MAIDRGKKKLSLSSLPNVAARLTRRRESVAQCQGCNATFVASDSHLDTSALVSLVVPTALLDLRHPTSSSTGETAAL